MLSLDDDLWHAADLPAVDRPRTVVRKGELGGSWCRAFDRAQRHLEEHQREQRLTLLRRSQAQSEFWREHGIDICVDLPPTAVDDGGS
jgi:hypothetical protein